MTTLARLLPVTAALARRPDLWPAALAAAASLRPDRWWRRWPFLPLPDADWLRFRMVTAYGGDGSGPIVTADVITWLEWQRANRA
ncbi:MAG: hypothetical protein AAF467_10785 [Actinomycetota bacterium]